MKTHQWKQVWRFDPETDTTSDKGSRVTYVNVDAPGIGSMRIAHEAGVSREQANVRATLAASAPALLEALEEFLADADAIGGLGELEEFWPDLAVTYNHATAAIEAARGEG